MAEYVHDQYGDTMQVHLINSGPDAGSIRLRIQETGPDGEERVASLGPFDPVAVISAVQGAAGIDIKGLDKRKEEQLLRHARDAKEDGEKLPVDPDLIEKLIMLAGREPFAPATAEAPRPRAEIGRESRRERGWRE